MWRIRLALACLLFLGSDVLLWRDPIGRAPLEWLTVISGCIGLAALLLDVAVRARVRDIFGALLLAGIAGLANFVLIDTRPPADLFLAIAARAFGAYLVAALLMVALLRWLAGGWHARSAALVALPTGVIAVLWSRWVPAVTGMGSAPDLVTLSLWSLGPLLLAAVLMGSLPRNAVIGDLRLRRPELTVALALVALSAVLRAALAPLDPLALILPIGFALLCGLILWYQTRSKGRSYTDLLHMPTGLRWGALVIAAAGLLVGLIGGTLVPATLGTIDTAALIGSAFTAIGLVWLPTVALVYGWRSIRSDVRAMRL